jgi:hypothetical protein
MQGLSPSVTWARHVATNVNQRLRFNVSEGSMQR